MSQRDEFVGLGAHGPPGRGGRHPQRRRSPAACRLVTERPGDCSRRLEERLGQAELDELFAHLAESFSDCESYEFDLLEVEVLGDTAYTVGFEHILASVNRLPSTYTLRATQIYRREGGKWKVAHRHGSAPPD